MQDFIINNYIWIIIICLFIIFTLIGYMADKKNKVKSEKQFNLTNDNNNDNSINNMENNNDIQPQQENISFNNNQVSLTLDELINQNNISQNMVKTPESENQQQNTPIPQIIGNWEPELEKENDKIITQIEEKEDSK